MIRRCAVNGLCRAGMFLVEAGCRGLSWMVEEVCSRRVGRTAGGMFILGVWDGCGVVWARYGCTAAGRVALSLSHKRRSAVLTAVG